MITTTLVGHACLLIQSKETTILTDPVWFDYLWEENTTAPLLRNSDRQIPSAARSIGFGYGNTLTCLRNCCLNPVFLAFYVL